MASSGLTRLIACAMAMEPPGVLVVAFLRVGGLVAGRWDVAAPYFTLLEYATSAGLFQLSQHVCRSSSLKPAKLGSQK